MRGQDTIVVHKALLARHRIVDREQAGLTGDWLHNRLHSLLQLLLIHIHGRNEGLEQLLLLQLLLQLLQLLQLLLLLLLLEMKLLLGLAQAEVLELLGRSGDIEQLLLQLLLLSGEVQVSRHQFRIQLFI